MELNKVIHGDCLDVLKDMEDNSIDLVLTDPPYGIGYDKTQDSLAKNKRSSNGGSWKEYGDNWDIKITPEYIEQILRVSKNQIIWGGNYYAELGHTDCWLIWNKIQRGYMTDGEMAWTSFNKGLKIFDFSRADAYINKTDGKFHPTQKPHQLLTWCLGLFSNENDIILDPFLGSGTTAIACIKTNRNFIGIEKEQKYVEIANKRIQNELDQLKLF